MTPNRRASRIYLVASGGWASLVAFCCCFCIETMKETRHQILQPDSKYSINAQIFCRDIFRKIFQNLFPEFFPENFPQLISGKFSGKFSRTYFWNIFRKIFQNLFPEYILQYFLEKKKRNPYHYKWKVYQFLSFSTALMQVLGLHIYLRVCRVSCLVHRMRNCRWAKGEQYNFLLCGYAPTSTVILPNDHKNVSECQITRVQFDRFRRLPRTCSSFPSRKICLVSFWFRLLQGPPWMVCRWKGRVAPNRLQRQAACRTIKRMNVCSTLRL